MQTVKESIERIIVFTTSAIIGIVLFLPKVFDMLLSRAKTDETYIVIIYVVLGGVVPLLVSGPASLQVS